MSGEEDKFKKLGEDPQSHLKLFVGRRVLVEWGGYKRTGTLVYFEFGSFLILRRDREDEWPGVPVGEWRPLFGAGASPEEKKEAEVVLIPTRELKGLWRLVKGQ